MPQNRDRAEVEAGRVEPEEALDPVLTAFRAVVGNAKRFDRGGLEKDARAWREKDGKGFLAKYQELEKQERAAREAQRQAEVAVERAADQGSAVADEAEDRVLELLGTLLAEWPDQTKGT